MIDNQQVIAEFLRFEQSTFAQSGAIMGIDSTKQLASSLAKQMDIDQTTAILFLQMVCCDGGRYYYFGRHLGDDKMKDKFLERCVHFFDTLILLNNDYAILQKICNAIGLDVVIKVGKVIEISLLKVAPKTDS